MATATTIVLSSPPRCLQTSCVLEHSNSPQLDELPSLNDVYATSSGPSVDSQGAISTTEDVASGFTTARSLLDTQVARTQFRPPPGAIRLGLAQRYRYNTISPQAVPVSVSNEAVKNASLQPISRASSASLTSLEHDRPKDGKGLTCHDQSKNREAKGKQVKIKPAKIVKPGTSDAATRVEAKAKYVDIQGRSKKRSIVTDLLADSGNANDGKSATNHGAIKRRRDWTPTKDSDKRTRITPESHGGSPGAGTAFEDSRRTASLKHELGRFGFQASLISASASTSQIANKIDQSSFTTKHRVEILETSGLIAGAAETPKRSVSPVKKPQTITDKATAPFNNHLEVNEPAGVLQNYFSVEPSAERAQTPQLKGKSKRKSVLKKAQRQAQQVIVLSPESAMKRAQDQDIMFGTSSQLARDESPTYIKDLQRALKASEEATHATEEEQASRNETQDWSKRLGLAPSKRLWAAASRDLDHDLMQSEPIVRKPKTIPSVQSDENQNLPKPKPDADTSFQDIDGFVVHCEKAEEKGANGAAARIGKSTMEAHSLVANDMQGDVSAHQDRVPPLPPGVAASPDFNSYTTPQLRKMVADFRFKAIRKRVDMIRLLEQCRESQRLLKQGLVLSQIPADPAKVSSDDGEKVSGPTTVKRKGRPPKDTLLVAGEVSPQRKPRGRPKKANSNADSTPKPKKNPVPRKKKQADLQVINVSPKTDCANNGDLAPSKTGRKVRIVLSEPLAKAISKAVSSQLPTHDMRNLSWHEKFMLYDPIVIEDLMAWLNEEGLNGVGEDNKVDVLQVKEWCEGRSICCLSKENLKGGSKARW